MGGVGPQAKHSVYLGVHAACAGFRIRGRRQFFRFSVAQLRL
jgi:hypothetical protein